MIDRILSAICGVAIFIAGLYLFAWWVCPCGWYALTGG